MFISLSDCKEMAINTSGLIWPSPSASASPNSRARRMARRSFFFCKRFWWYTFARLSMKSAHLLQSATKTIAANPFAFLPLFCFSLGFSCSIAGIPKKFEAMNARIIPITSATTWIVPAASPRLRKIQASKP